MRAGPTTTAQNSAPPVAAKAVRPISARGILKGLSGAREAMLSASTGPTKTMLRSETRAMARKASAISAVAGEREPRASAQSQAAKMVATPR